MRRTAFLALGTLSILVLMLAGLALAAHWESANDPNDTPGKLDFDRTALRVPDHLHPTGDPVQCRIRFIRHVRVQTFTGRNNPFCQFDFRGRDPSAPPDAYVRAFFDAEKQLELVGELYLRTPSGYELSDIVPVYYKRDRGVLRFDIPRRYLAGRDTFIRWRTWTRFKNNTSCSSFCRDWGPSRRRWYRYNLGGGPRP